MLNLLKSYEIYIRNKGNIIPGDCYNNVPRILATNFFTEFRKNTVKLAICYCGTDDYLIRHCVIILNNEIIDINLFTDRSIEEVQDFIDKNNPKYYILKEFGADEYLTALFKSNELASLQDYMKEYDLKFFKECNENNRKINNVDYNSFIAPLL